MERGCRERPAPASLHQLLPGCCRDLLSPPSPPCRPPGSDGWFYNLNSASQASLRDIIRDGFLYPKDNKLS